MTTENIRHHYAIGDLQGCYDAFERLLSKIDFDPKQDKIWLAGDLVARGEDSLKTLRKVKSLHEQGAAQTVLGNHDINLLAVWRGIAKLKKKDNTAEVIWANDCHELMQWLRKQPLMVFPDENTVMVHAGIPPHWRIQQAAQYAKELELALQDDLTNLDKLLPNLYNKTADDWSDQLTGCDRLRAICNYLTRMRLCDETGHLEFKFKAGLAETLPVGFKPWFEWPSKGKRERKVLFGHWAALNADIDLPKARALDAGCVWGGQLLAYRLADQKVFTVSA